MHKSVASRWTSFRKTAEPLARPFLASFFPATKLELEAHRVLICSHKGRWS